MIIKLDYSNTKGMPMGATAIMSASEVIRETLQSCVNKHS
jgi:hypothetical protein